MGIDLAWKIVFLRYKKGGSRAECVPVKPLSPPLADSACTMSRWMGEAGRVEGGAIPSDAGWVNLRMLWSHCLTLCRSQPDGPFAFSVRGHCMVDLVLPNGSSKQREVER